MLVRAFPKLPSHSRPRASLAYKILPTLLVGDLYPNAAGTAVEPRETPR